MGPTISSVVTPLRIRTARTQRPTKSIAPLDRSPIDGVGGFVAKWFFIVTLIPINQTLIDSAVTTGTYQAMSPCELKLVASGEPNGGALKSGALLSVTTDSIASAQHAWVYRGGARPQTCP